jgi:hypothetical protein
VICLITKPPIQLAARQASESGRWLGYAGLGTVKKQPHAQSFGPLHGHEPHLAANMVGVFKEGYLGLVLLGISLQPFDAIFDCTTEPRANFKSFIDSGIPNHERLLMSWNS